MMDFAPIAYSVAMIAAFGLALGGVLTGMKQGNWKRGLLMIFVAVAIVANVVIWTVPLPSS